MPRPKKLKKQKVVEAVVPEPRFLDPARSTTLRFVIELPVYGKPEQDLQTAQELLRSLRVSVHSKVKVWLLEDAVSSLVHETEWHDPGGGGPM